MNLALFRRDEALRSLPLWGVPLLLNASLLIGLVVARALRDGSGVSATAVVTVGWLTVALFLVLGPGRSRCHTFELALPIPARTLWLAHLSAVAAGAVALALGYVAAVAVIGRVLRGRLSLDADLPGLAIQLAAAALLATILLQVPRLSVARPGFTAGYAAWAAIVAFGTLGILAAIGGSGPLGGLALLAISIVAAVIAYRSVPPAFAVVEREPRPQGSVAPGADPVLAADAVPAAEPVPGAPRAGDEARGGRRLVRASWLASVVGLNNGARESMAYLLAVAAGLFIGGVTKAWESDTGIDDIRFAYIPLASYALFTLVLKRLAVLHHFDPLPVPRRRLFLALTLSAATAFVVPFGIGAIIASRFAARTEFVDFSKGEGDGRWSLDVPLRVYRIAWDGRVPMIPSPWGESHAADSNPLVRGLAPVIWNPYSAPAGSSARFVALQVSRAAEAVYGASLPPETIENRWLESSADGSVAGRLAHLPLRAEVGNLSVRPGPVFPISMTLILAPWLLFVALLLRAFRAGIGERVRYRVFLGVMGIFLGTMLAMIAVILANIARPWFARALVEIPAWSLRGNPAGVAATWAVGALVTIAAWRVTLGQFQAMEIPATPLKFCLLPWFRNEER